MNYQKDTETSSIDQIDSNSSDKPDVRRALREKAELILPDSLMIVLALLMIPIVVLPMVFDLSESLDTFLLTADYFILGIFAIEYILKTVSAKNVREHMLDPWHLLDLLIIVLAVVGLIPMLASGRASPVLRLLRILRIIAVGSRTAKRRVGQQAISVTAAFSKPQMAVKVIDLNLKDVTESTSLSSVKECFGSSTHCWIDISSVSESNYEELSTALDIPLLLLENELIEEAYPRVDYFKHYSMIFARIADIKILSKGSKRLIVNRSGLLVIYTGRNIITISKKSTGLFNQILENTRKYHSPDNPLAVSVLYAILKYTLEKDSQIISAIEQEIIVLENIPFNERPPYFLETAFHLKREISQLVPSLLHMKEITGVISTSQIPFDVFNDQHKKLFDSLMDQSVYLRETAENARDDLLSLIDLYINRTSFELNKVMRIVAVITSLGVIPAVLGLLGSNLVGNPWDIELWQIFVWLGVMMLALGWVFYRLGWLKD